MGIPFCPGFEENLSFRGFSFWKVDAPTPVMGIGFDEVELKNNLIGYFKITIFYSRQWKL
jgi:uncharacterized protein YhbP (UPF0306 family)